MILVTSALPGEGKTFTALNLALSIVRDRELRVILVDADVERPGLTPALGLEGNPGLNDVLEDTSREIDSVTYQTDVEGLFVVPAGKWHDQAPEFFAGSRMPQVIEELIRRVGNGVVVLDSPPLLATNEAQVVTRYVGQVLFVVRAEDTEQRAVREAIALVDQSASVSAVLNRVQPSAIGSYYGHYHYGYGDGEDARDAAREANRGGSSWIDSNRGGSWRQLLLGMFGVALPRPALHDRRSAATIGTGLGQIGVADREASSSRVSKQRCSMSRISNLPGRASRRSIRRASKWRRAFMGLLSGTAIGAIDYSLIGRIWDESDFDDVSHRLGANGQWFAVPEWFSLTGQAGYEDAVIDPRNGLNYGGIGIFGQDNLQEVATAGLSPILQRRVRDSSLSRSTLMRARGFSTREKANPLSDSLRMRTPRTKARA